jgi:hypothetical protein
MQFVLDDNGPHQLGGEIPGNFKIPENEFPAGMQYLGCINNSDKFFEWLPFPLHLICPIFTDFDFVYLDYENPNEPRLLYPTNSAEITTAYDELSKDSFIVYNKANFSLQPFEGINDDNEFDIVALAGKPHWTQDAELPTSPKSNKKMQFVCQLMSNGPIKAKEKNFKGSNDFNEEIFSELNFWCDGDLKVFFEPISKVACYFIQNT